MRSLTLCGLLAAISAVGCAPARVDILLVVADTVRADRVSAYGYWRRTTPQIEGSAKSVRIDAETSERLRSLG